MSAAIVLTPSPQATLYVCYSSNYFLLGAQSGMSRQFIYYIIVMSRLLSPQ